MTAPDPQTVREFLDDMATDAVHTRQLLHGNAEITDLATLESLPLGAGVADGDGTLWQRGHEGGRDGSWYSANGETGFVLNADLLEHHGPSLRLIWLPTGATR